VSIPYDFEFPFVPPAVCNRCGAQVQKRDLHDEWHASVVTRDLLIDVLGTATRRENYDQ
jgi:hypothetical protein